MADFTRLPEIVPPLLDWYAHNARSMPWRDDPTPYHVLVSEVMLQQTRVEAVRAYYERFLSALPTLASLAACEEERLLKLWEGLGYYSRARNLQAAARMTLAQFGGVLPQTPDELRRLPGIGDYCAGSIASIAYQTKTPAVDGNVLRVISRLAASDDDVAKPATKRLLTQRVAAILPDERCGDFNQALMELGALVCLPNGAPLCGSCPLASLCEAHRLGLEQALPVKAPKPTRRVEELSVLLLRDGGRLALRKRPEKGLLAGLWELPTFSGAWQDFFAENGLIADAPQPGRRAKHIFTHIEWHMSALETTARADTLPDGWVWATDEEITDTYALPGAFAKLLGRK
jgi:A/G-specific adenine glycosylase